MSKITFRADDDLVSRLEEFDASKSEVMREALREYLDRDRRTGSTEGQDASATTASSASTAAAAREATTLDDALATRIDELFEERLGRMLDERLDRRIDRRLATFQPRATQPQDIDLSISLDGARVADAASDVGREREGTTGDPRGTADASATSDGPADAQADPSPAKSDETEPNCNQCGESLSGDHVYCPNCGEKRSHRVFCDCGDEVRTDWAFCPSCGRRTPAADVLDRP